MLARGLRKLGLWLSRKRSPLAIDPVWRSLNDNEAKARKAHRSTRQYQAEKRERIHTALNWKGGQS